MERLRLDHVDGMRAVAALVVFLNHAYFQTWCYFYDRFPPAPFAFLSHWLAIGHLAVSVFIVISGFCLYLPLTRSEGALRGGAIPFLRRRARRILPPYFAALALSLLLIATIIGDETGSPWDVSARVRGIDVASHVLLLQNVFGTGRINYAFWSIALEWQIYFLSHCSPFSFSASARWRRCSEASSWATRSRCRRSRVSTTPTSTISACSRSGWPPLASATWDRRKPRAGSRGRRSPRPTC
jgi:peptidoglycan/LPS O-acetylase OafA/YrhL